ncbi:uncharacterized protein LOC127873601 isoform X2 [Dreissena polymorpha]|uniref:uncharacterized protein LOC127873601 isoform X2 n=1 Tax=Dreissena polymorpha TaxID=45954 RepID=UPI0022653539|nr:uncharacterized protein LOC127873601 isoform X2 [Dreissena polymorpha]
MIITSHIFCILRSSIFLIVLMSPLFCQDLYGASIYWRPTNANKIAFSFRMIWEGMGSIEAMKKSCLKFPSALRPTCESKVDTSFNDGLLSIKDPRITTKVFANYTWMCTHGCRMQGRVISNLSQLFFIDLNSFYETKWESGVGTVDVQFDDQDDTENIRIGLTYPNGSLVSDLGEAHLNMAARNDTKRPNISPLVNVFPVYRTPKGCNITIRLFPFDGDGDNVKCYWQSLPLKDSPQSHSTLNSETCEVIFTATSNLINIGDVIPLSLYAEDYTDEAVEFVGSYRYITAGPFCRTPIKLMVTIGNAIPCHTDRPVFDKELTLPLNYKHSYEAADLAKTYDKLLPFGTDNLNDKILTSGPKYMIFTTKRNFTVITEGTWKDIHDLGMKGIHQACGMAYSDQGIPGESRCSVLLMFEPDECKAAINPCGKDGVCDNYFEHFTCRYPDINLTEHQFKNGDCHYGILVWAGNDKTLLKIGLPVGLSLLLLLVIIITTCILRHYWKEKMQTDISDKDTPVRKIANKSLDF